LSPSGAGDDTARPKKEMVNFAQVMADSRCNIAISLIDDNACLPQLRLVENDRVAAFQR
jgi:hypothetical protein